MVCGMTLVFEIDPDWERMAPYLECNVASASFRGRCKEPLCGPESFTHDGAPALAKRQSLETTL